MSQQDEMPTIGQQQPIVQEPPVKEEVQNDVPEKKTFSRQDAVRFVECPIYFPDLYPDYEPFGFKFRLKLSAKAEEARQEFISLSAVEQTETEHIEALEEVCDLLVELPTGFSDLKYDGRSPGSSFKTYVETCPDPDVKDFLYMVAIGANSAYWGAVSPKKFRRKV